MDNLLVVMKDPSHFFVRLKDEHGYKLKGGYGGPLLPEEVQKIEDMKSSINNSKRKPQHFTR